MLRGRTLAFLVSLAMLALPATSFAQSAGDDQYQDPLANSGGGSTSGHTSDTGGGGSGSSSSSSGGSGGGGGGGSSSAGTPSTGSGSNVPAAGSAGTATPTSGAAASGTPAGQLPRTGFDVVVTFELGFALLLVGLVAQRMVVLRERRDSRH
jgi:hypothetical protein